jgi:hypothetical protein
LAKAYRTEQPAPNVLDMRFEDIKSGWEQWFLLSSDRHHDNLHCNHALELKHLKQAKERNAIILDFGDLACAMQGKWDKRADPDAMRPELVGKDYLNKLTKYNTEFYEPFKDLFGLVTPGNHETAILKHHGYNLTQAFCDKLGIPMGTYAGWVRFKFIIGNTGCSLWLYYNHGYGGGGAVTKGVIQTNRMAVYLPDATFVVTGHTHDRWILPLGRTRINDAGVPFQDEQWHIKAGGYKDEFGPGEGWHIETGKEPKPVGAVWLRMWVVNKKILFEMTPTPRE